MGSFRFSLLSMNRDGVPIGVAGHGSYFLRRALGLVGLITCTARAGTSSQIINTFDQSCIRVGEEHYLNKSQIFCFETKNLKIFVVQKRQMGNWKAMFCNWCLVLISLANSNKRDTATRRNEDLTLGRRRGSYGKLVSHEVVTVVQMLTHTLSANGELLVRQFALSVPLTSAPLPLNDRANTRGPKRKNYNTQEQKIPHGTQAQPE